MVLARPRINRTPTDQEAPMAVDQAIHDAETSLDTLLAYLAPLASLRDNLRAMADEVLAEAQREADAFVANAKTRASEMDTAAEKRVAEHELWSSAAKDETAKYTAAIGELEAKHTDLTAKVTAAQAHLDQIESEVAATLARFGVKSADAPAPLPQVEVPPLAPEAPKAVTGASQAQ